MARTPSSALRTVPYVASTNAAGIAASPAAGAAAPAPRNRPTLSSSEMSSMFQSVSICRFTWLGLGFKLGSVVRVRVSRCPSVASPG